MKISREKVGNFFAISRAFITFASTITKNVTIMATIEFRLSKKTQAQTGRREVMIRFFHGRVDIYAPSGIFINPEYFSYYIDRRKTEREGASVPPKVATATEDEAAKRGWSIKASGLMVISKRIETPEVAFHREQQRRLADISNEVAKAFEGADKSEVSSKWLKTIIDKYNHPERYGIKKAAKGFQELLGEYLQRKSFSYSNHKNFETMGRAVSRYERFVRETDKQRRDFTFDIDKVTSEDMQAFFDYYKNESELKKEYPTIFKRLVSGAPRRGRSEVSARGSNTLIAMSKRMKAFFNWLHEVGKTHNRPFEGIDMESGQFGEPYYLTREERDIIASHDFSQDKHMETMRDIFIFQCFVGCRVGDLSRLLPSNIVGGMLVYTPHKTKDKGEQQRQARVPLHPTAAALVAKYEGKDMKGRLFPFTFQTDYNKAIKTILTECGVTRNVTWRNPKTGEGEQRPINELATSHMARRTFIGNCYLLTPDPNVIGRMSGHVEGCKAFARYRKIEDETLQDVISKI